ncbi:putative arp2 3 complex subunit [Erysiphe necator]|uniref:Actin-related protein 2/3 complex subunit 5 n=1 Tax=Uncinula necator TaxID=52586 RepID=A0A0B1P553_UNCNE|nr:putative arp2 3 complex subunit [Erysiphe necator]
MSVIQQQSNATLSDNWRTINIDILDPDSSTRFDPSTLHSSGVPVSEDEINSIGQQIRQLLRGGDAEGALRSALEFAPYSSSSTVKETHLATVVEVLQSIKASEMTPLLKRIYHHDTGVETLDTLMKYLYRGMASYGSGKNNSNIRKSAIAQQNIGFPPTIGRHGVSNESSGAAMSVLLSWHEKVVETAGLGCIGRCMTDWRKV